MTTTKDLPELPEPVYFGHGPSGDYFGYDDDQLQAYGAACAAHAREVALSEAMQEAVKRHNAGEVGAVLISRAIEQLKANTK